MTGSLKSGAAEVESGASPAASHYFLDSCRFGSPRHLIAATAPGARTSVAIGTVPWVLAESTTDNHSLARQTLKT